MHGDSYKSEFQSTCHAFRRMYDTTCVCVYRFILKVMNDGAEKSNQTYLRLQYNSMTNRREEQKTIY